LSEGRHRDAAFETAIESYIDFYFAHMAIEASLSTCAGR